MVAVNPAGMVLVVAGAWVLCQVFGGDALGRLGIVDTGQTPPKWLGKKIPQTGGGGGGGGGGSW